MSVTHSLVASGITPTDFFPPITQLTYSISLFLASTAPLSEELTISSVILLATVYQWGCPRLSFWAPSLSFSSLCCLTVSWLGFTKFIFSLDLFCGPQLMPTIFKTGHLTSFKLLLLVTSPNPRWKLESSISLTFTSHSWGLHLSPCC